MKQAIDARPSRIKHIDRKASELGCSTELQSPESCDRLKAALP